MKWVMVALIAASVTAMPLLVFGASFDRDLFYGLRTDAEVIRLQDFLRGKGFFTAQSTGNFFDLTRGAVQQFQAVYNIPATGYFGPLSRARANTLFQQSVSLPLAPHQRRSGLLTTPSPLTAGEPTLELAPLSQEIPEPPDLTAEGEGIDLDDIAVLEDASEYGDDTGD